MNQFPWIRLILVLSLLACIAASFELIKNGRGNITAPAPQAMNVPPPAILSPAAPQASGGVAAPSVPATPLSSPSVNALAAAAEAAARTELQEAAKRLTEAAADLDEARKQFDIWQTDIEPLRENADGRAIAAHPELARQMAYLLQQQRLTKANLEQVDDRIKSMRNEVDRLSTAATIQRLPPEQLLEVQELRQRAGEAGRRWRDAVDRAQAIVREARRQQPPVVATPPSIPPAAGPAAEPLTPPPPATPSQPSPATTADSTPPKTPDSAKPADAATTAATTPPPMPVAPPQEPTPPPGKSLQEKVVEISDLDKLQMLKEQAARDEQRQRERERLAEADRVQAEKRAVEKAKLVAEARSEEVQRVLQPFLVKRNIQPRLAGASVQWRQTNDQQPMSLLALENVGALADSLPGLSTLARVGSHRELSGARWDFNPSPRTWSGDTQDRLKHAQELLRRLGPTLVEEHLLSP